MGTLTKIEKIREIIACPAWDGYDDEDTMDANTCDQEIDDIFDSLGIVEDEIADGSRDEEGYLV
jgi:hypothetical protein